MSSSGLRIYIDASSPHAQYVMFFTALKGLQYEPVLMDWVNRQKELCDINPFHAIPTLVDGDYGLFESRAICRYLDDRFANQGPKLIPTDLRQRGKMEQWCSVEHAAFTPDMIGLIRQRVWTPLFRGTPPDEAKCKESMEKLKKTLVILNTHLADKQFLIGDQLSLADVFFAPLVEECLDTPEKTQILDEHPHFYAWWKRIAATPAWKSVVKAKADNKATMEENLRKWKEAEKAKAAQQTTQA